MKRKHFFLFGLFLLLLNDANAATTVDGGSFDTIYDAFKAWIGGSLGYVIALLGTIGNLLIYALGYMGSNRGWSFVLSGIFISCLVGGVVGIAQTMFNLGAGTFN